MGPKHSFDCLLVLSSSSSSTSSSMCVCVCVSTHEFGLGILRTHSPFFFSLSPAFLMIEKSLLLTSVGNVGALMGGMAAEQKKKRRRGGSKETKMSGDEGSPMAMCIGAARGFRSFLLYFFLLPFSQRL